MRGFIIFAIVVMVVVGSFIGCSKDTEPATEATVEKDTKCFEVLKMGDALIFIETDSIEALEPYYDQLEWKFVHKSGIYVLSIEKYEKYPESGTYEFWFGVRGSANGEYAKGLGDTPGGAVGNMEWYSEPVYDEWHSVNKLM